MRADLEKGLEGLSGAYEEERRRQLAVIEEKIAERQKLVTQHAIDKRIEAEKKLQEEEIARLGEQDQVREFRRQKIELTKQIVDSQKMTFKQCYSRPLWPFNKMMYDANMKADNFSSALEQKNQLFQKEVMSTLLTKVTGLEEKVSIDTTRTKRHGNVTPKVLLSNRLKKNDNSDSQSNATG